jgi:hypothetical protein
MKSGQIKENGIQSVKAMATLIEQQTVEYDFQYYQQSYPINVGILLISDGRSMFKNTLHVPLQKSGAASPAQPFDEEKFKQVLSDQELLGQIRRFFLALQTFSEVTLQDFAIPPAVSEYAQGVFVELRKQEHETSAGKELKTTAETFHQWLTLSRLVALS